MKKKCILCGEVLCDEAIFALDNAPIGAQHMPEASDTYGGGGKNQTLSMQMVWIGTARQ